PYPPHLPYPPSRSSRRIETEPQLVLHQEERQVVIAFEAWFLPDFVPLLEPDERHRHRPGLPEDLRIDERGLVEDGVGIHEREAFRDVQGFAVKVARDAQPRAIRQVRRIDDER